LVVFVILDEEDEEGGGAVRFWFASACAGWPSGACEDGLDDMHDKSGIIWLLVSGSKFVVVVVLVLVLVVVLFVLLFCLAAANEERGGGFADKTSRLQTGQRRW
jgi:hypothetical protein